jgi:hypothetical protein
MAEPDRLQPGKPLAAAGAAERIENWSLTSLQQRQVKTAATSDKFGLWKIYMISDQF